MRLQSLHINNSSKEFLDLVTKLKGDKDAKVKALLSTIALPEALTKTIVDVVIAIDDNKGIDNAST